MEILNPFSTNEDIADAVKGSWGKEVTKDYSVVYCGQLVIGIGEKSILDKYCAVKHYDWVSIGDNVWLAIVK